MTECPPTELRVVAIDPSPRGLGFAVLEGPDRLIDWGVTDIRGRGKNGLNLHRLVTLIERWQPDVLVLEDWRRADCRRCRRVKQLLRHAARLAVRRRLREFAVSRDLLLRAFPDLDPFTKEALAKVIVGHFPELAVWLPPHRKPWMSEDHRMAIFDAVTFGVAYFHHEALAHQSQELTQPSPAPAAPRARG